jgi:hypothetical protein
MTRTALSYIFVLQNAMHGQLLALTHDQGESIQSYFGTAEPHNRTTQQYRSRQLPGTETETSDCLSRSPRGETRPEEKRECQIVIVPE